MGQEQTCVSTLFKEVKIANEINGKILDVIDSFELPKNDKEVDRIGVAIADLISKELYERQNIDQQIGVELEFLGDKPKFSIYKVSEGCGCGGSC